MIELKTVLFKLHALFKMSMVRTMQFNLLFKQYYKAILFKASFMACNWYKCKKLKIHVRHYRIIILFHWFLKYLSVNLDRWIPPFSILLLTLTGNKPRNVFHIRIAWEDQVIDTLYNRSCPA